MAEFFLVLSASQKLGIISVSYGLAFFISNKNWFRSAYAPLNLHLRYLLLKFSSAI